MGIAQRNLSHISFSDFLGKIMMCFRERDVITTGIPPKLGIPHDFVPISSWNMHSDTLIGTNDTCFVENFI